MEDHEQFRQIVEDRGWALRALPWGRLREMNDVRPEIVTVGKRKGTVSVIVEPGQEGSLKVVVQGFLDSCWFPRLQTVALDGFYKHPDDSVTEMRDSEFWDYD